MKIRILPIGMYQENSIVVHEQGHVLIVDPGGHPEIIQQEIADDETVEAIVLTHGHEDHVSAVDALVDIYHCPVYLNDRDRELVDPKTSASHMFARPVHAKITSLPSHLDCSVFHLDVLETPGHTLGSVCLLMEHVMFSGDTLFAGSIGRTDLDESDPHLMQSSLEKLKALDQDYHVIPGHGPATLLSTEKQTNVYLR
ncbi:MAG: MBL fold metallo-hydrolase [Bulleidia sp.]